MGIIKNNKNNIIKTSNISFDTYKCTYLGDEIYTNFPDRSYILKLKDLPVEDIKDRIGQYHNIGIELSFTLPSELELNRYYNIVSHYSNDYLGCNILEFKNLFNLCYGYVKNHGYYFYYWSYMDNMYKNLTSYSKYSIKREFKLIASLNGIDFPGGDISLYTMDGEMMTSQSGSLKFHNYYNLTDYNWMSFGGDMNQDSVDYPDLHSTLLDGKVDINSFKITDNTTGEVLVQIKHLS